MSKKRKAREVALAVATLTPHELDLVLQSLRASESGWSFVEDQRSVADLVDRLKKTPLITVRVED